MPPLNGCEVCCNTNAWSRNKDSWRAAVLQILCSINEGGGGGTTGGINFVILCDPGTGDPVFVRLTSTDGTIDGAEAFNLDGTAYGGTIADLVSCGGGSGTNFVYAEDSAHADGANGAYVLSVRQDTLASSTGASGDYQSLKTTALGALWTQSVALKAEDTAHASGDLLMPMGGVRNEGAAQFADTELDYTPWAMTRRGTGFVDINYTNINSAERPTSILKQEDAAHASGEVGVGILSVVQATLASSVSADGDYGFSKLNNVGALWVAPAGATNGGATPFVRISTADTNAAVIKASAGQVYSVQVGNINAAVRYLKLYDKATAPTVGTDTPVKVLPIPGDTTGAGSNVSIPVGSAFANGISMALTTGIAHTDTGAVAANEIVVNIDYK